MRQVTFDDHKRLDSLLGRLDLTDWQDYGYFLAISHAGFETLEPKRAYADWPGIDALKQAALDALHSDLSQLGFPVLPAERIPVHPVSLAYVVLGSRLGAVQLARSWSRATHPVVRVAGAYFSLPPQTDAWRYFCSEIEQWQSDTDEAEVILGDASRAFGVFEAAFHRCQSSRYENSHGQS